MSKRSLPPEIQVFEVGYRRMYVKTGVRSFAISEEDITPEELVSIAKDLEERQAERTARRLERQVETVETSSTPA